MRLPIYLCSCIPCLSRKSAVQRSNLRALREIRSHLDEAPEDHQQAVHLFLCCLIQQLTDNFQSPPDLSTVRIFNRHLLSHVFNNGKLDQLISKIKQDRISNGSIPYIAPPHCTSTRASSISNPRDVALLNLLRQCSPNQLELVLQLDAVAKWEDHIKTTGLCYLSPINLPSPSSPITNGHIRVASWNLNRFNLDKAKHPGFREVVCLTILRANISLIVLQEIASVEAVEMLCAELNSPTLPHVKQWMAKYSSSTSGPRWQVITSVSPTGAMFRGSEYAAFIYDTTKGIKINKTSILDSSSISKGVDRLFSRNPCHAVCRVRSSKLILSSVHLKSRGLRNSRIGRTTAEIKLLDKLVTAFFDTQSDSHLIIIGDFNLNPTHEAFNGLRQSGFKSVLNGSKSTTCTGPNSTSNNCPTAYDNAWLSPDLTAILPEFPVADKTYYVGLSGVIQDGLRHPLIPNDTGAGANGSASDHRPIWFDLHIS